MSDYSELKRLAEEAIRQCDDGGKFAMALRNMQRYAGPTEVLALIAENERLEEEYDKAWRHDLNDKNNVQALAAEVARLTAGLEQAKAIARIAYNFDGYKQVLDERDQFKAENEALGNAATTAASDFRKAADWICRKVEAGTESATHWAIRLGDNARALDAAMSKRVQPRAT